MKIGIFTLHGTTNYGGALQAFALSEVLKKMGHEPEIVRTSYVEHVSVVRRIIGVLTSYSFYELYILIVKYFFGEKVKCAFVNSDERIETFQTFYRENVVYTHAVKADELPEFVLRYDAIVAGSDQVWTQLYSSNLIAFFDFFDQYKGIRISYAACSAHQKVPCYNRWKVKKLLLKFDAISVRDETTRKLVKNVSGIEPLIVADPTLLLDSSPYIGQPLINEPYIFCYILGDAPAGGGHQAVFTKIKERYDNIKVLGIVPSSSSINEHIDICLEAISPFEWVNLICHAKFVYTDSFHAILFSIKFQKDFLAYYSEVTRASRLLALKNMFGLDNRVVGHTDQIDLKSNLYENNVVANRFQQLTKVSIDFLNSALKNG